MTEHAARTVAVIGGGAIGHGVAQCFAQAGFPTAMYNRTPASSRRMMERIRFNLDTLVENGWSTPEAADATYRRIRPETDLEAAARGADFVVEAVAEDLPLKHAVFKRLDAICPAPAILATDTSGLSITEIARPCSHRERVIGTHFFTPPHIVPGVEVIPGDETDELTVQRTVALLKAVGKQPGVVKNVIGFVVGRMSSALRREAFALVEQGIAEPEAIDALWRTTVGPNYAALGPCLTSDVSGLDVLATVHDYMEPWLTPPSTLSPLVRAMAERGEYGMKSGQGFYTWTPAMRDRILRRRDRIMALLRDLDAELNATTD